MCCSLDHTNGAVEEGKIRIEVLYIYTRLLYILVYCIYVVCRYIRSRKTQLLIRQNLISCNCFIIQGVDSLSFLIIHKRNRGGGPSHRPTSGALLKNPRTDNPLSRYKPQISVDQYRHPSTGKQRVFKKDDSGFEEEIYKNVCL